MKCPICDLEMTHKQGTSKATGKAWSGWFCEDKSHQPVWDKTEVKTPARQYQPRPLSSDVGKLNDKDRAFGQAKGAAFNKSVDVIIAAYNKGEVNYEDIPKMVEGMFQELVKINASDEVA